MRRAGSGLLIELQVYEAWWFAVIHKQVSKAPLRAQPIIRCCIKKFPSIRRADLAAKQLGQRMLDEAKQDPSLIMPIDRQVDDDLARRREAGRRLSRVKHRRSI